MRKRPPNRWSISCFLKPSPLKKFATGQHHESKTCKGELNPIHSWRAGHFPPPLASGRVIFRVLVEVPMPHETSQSPHSAQLETWQSITERIRQSTPALDKTKDYRVKTQLPKRDKVIHSLGKWICHKTHNILYRADGVDDPQEMERN